MRVCDHVQCRDFPCGDVNHRAYHMPAVNLNPQQVKILLISECAPTEGKDNYYAEGDSLFAQTTLLAFADAGLQVESMAELLEKGIYCTTAVKCAKTAYGIQTQTVKTCARLLAEEIALLPKVQVYLLMGDVAIKAVNEIARMSREKRVIPAGSTYKLRGQAYYFRGRRAFPSYLQAGSSFFIEKSKRKMIAEDIRAALDLVDRT